MLREKQKPPRYLSAWEIIPPRTLRVLLLLSMPKRLNRSAGRAENRPQASSEHTSLVATGNRRVVRLASQTDE